MVESDPMPNNEKDPGSIIVDPSEELRPFSEIKNKIEDVIDQVVQKNFHGKNYEAKAIQHLVNAASEEIIKQC